MTALWWIANAVLVLAVIPLVAWLAMRILRLLYETHRYAEDILEHGVGLSGNLDPVPELHRTGELISHASGLAGEYAAGLRRKL